MNIVHETLNRLARALQSVRRVVLTPGPQFFNWSDYMINRRGNLKALALAAAVSAGSLTFTLQAQAADTIKVGVLHSLSGTMAISETVLKDTVLMAIDEINAKGGVLGKKLEPVVVDPASN